MKTFSPAGKRFPPEIFQKKKLSKETFFIYLDKKGDRFSK